MDFSNRNYYSAMDHLDNTEFFTSSEPSQLDEEGNPLVPDGALNFSPTDIGLTTNPMQNPLESFKAQIKQGIGRIEFGFMGQGKGSAQSPTPESVGSLERRDMRELLKINNIKTSTHAAVHANSLAGFDGQHGFSDEVRSQALKEISKAIQFAGEATKGGAIVFHMHEWKRPLSEIKDDSGFKFEGHLNEGDDAVFYTVDKRTGAIIHGVKKDQIVYRPVYMTAKDFGLVGKRDEKSGRVLKENDLVDRDGNYLKKNGNFDDLEKRVPLFNKETQKFEVKSLNWEELEKEKIEYNQENNADLTVAEYQAKVQIENQLASIKGQQGYHMNMGGDFNSQMKKFEELKKDYALYKQLKGMTSEDDAWKLEAQFGSKLGVSAGESVGDAFEKSLKHIKDIMNYVGEIGSTEEARYLETKEKWKNVEDAEKYGLKKTADTIALAGCKAMEVYNKNKDKYGLEDPLYVAPENWNQNYYGSHPDEMRKIVLESRKAMVAMLKKKNYSDSEAKKLSEDHIKATLDIGHLNTLRYNFQGSDEDFNKWMLDEAEKLVKEGVVGHIHLSDNFGFDDEHLTPGQGNIPMQEFLKRMEERGMKDMILEVGSFNANTAYLDTFALANAPVYGSGVRQRFSQTHNAHFGQNAPGFFIAGAYSPSNAWKPWTNVPLE